MVIQLTDVFPSSDIRVVLVSYREPFRFSISSITRQKFCCLWTGMSFVECTVFVDVEWINVASPIFGERFPFVIRFIVCSVFADLSEYKID